MPLRSQSASSPVQVPTTLSMSAVAVAKSQTGSPGSPANNPASPALLQGVASPNIKQVKLFVSTGIFGQLGGLLVGPFLDSLELQECLHQAGS